MARMKRKALDPQPRTTGSTSQVQLQKNDILEANFKSGELQGTHTISSIFNEAVQACSSGKVPSIEDLNEFARTTYQIDLKKNLTDVKHVLKSNREIDFCSNLKKKRRVTEQTQIEKIAWKDSETVIQDTKREIQAKLKEGPQKGEIYQHLLALEHVDLVTNAEKIQCPVCFMDIDINQGVTLQDCLHSFCKKCLATTIEFSETALVKCPFQNDEYSCESYLQEREIKALATPEVNEKYLQRSITVAESLAERRFHCKTPHCPGWCVLEDDTYTFECPVCMQINCVTCATIHENEYCIQYKANNGVEYSFENDTRLSSNYIQTKFKKKECEEKETYQQLLALDNVDLIGNVEKFECPICFMDIDIGQGVTLQDCLHNFCKECLAGAIQFSENAFVNCPFQNDEYSCQSHLQDREIRALVTPEVYEKHLKKSMVLAESQAHDSFHCKTPDCPGWCFFEDDINIFQCPVCNHTNCLTCAAIHEGKNCIQYQDDLIFRCDSNEEARRTNEYLQNVLKDGKALRCPQCQIILMKKEGCDWVKCSMCHTEVCWVTKGPRWGPKGFGDTSGGCRCKVNGVYCHPNCKNCH